MFFLFPKDDHPNFSASFAQTANMNIKRHLIPVFGSLKLREVDDQGG